MRNCKRAIAFLIALSVLGANTPMSLCNTTGIVAFAGDSTQTAISISKQPESVICQVGDSLTFNIQASGSNLKYQWQYQFPGKNWTNWSNASAKTNTLNANALAVYDGLKVRCSINDGNGNTATSEEATITIIAPLTSSNPSDITISNDSKASFYVTATGTGDLTYLWESSVDGNTWTAVPDSNSATLTVDGATAVSGTQYRCTVSDAYGQSKTSEPATLTIETNNQCGDNLTYEYEDGTLTISGEGEMWSYTDAESSPFHDLDIDTLIIEDGVSVIGAHAFEDNNIQTVTLPESVFSIRYKAFWGNDNLDITIENIGCGIYDKSLPDNATVHGYSNSSAFHSSQGANQTFICLDDESAFDAQTNKIVLTVGDTYQIEAQGSKLRYYSFNSDIVTVDSNGLVTAVGIDGDDRDAKVMVYDKSGRSTVYYFAVVDEKTAPDYGWRYTIISPSSWDKSPFVPFWGQRVSLNEDVAEIVSWDHAQATGTFGTAPIISADDRGNAYIFYYTYDADIRPIKADETYREETYEINDDWQNAFYKPYYSYTAEEDTRVYFKAYGSEDLDVAVYSELGADPITSDYDGGRAEVSFDVKAGETVYIQPTSGQNQAFTYTMKLSTNAIETVAMTDNETYTITPDTAGDLTTLSFTAPADGHYLIEGKSNTAFYYQLANNIDFTTNVEFDENGIQLASPSTWSHETWSGDSSILPYYVWLNAGETVYIRGYFDGETTSDDSISFRVHAVTPVDTALTLNDMTNPNVISLNPDDYDRRTIEGKAEAQYIISTDSTDSHVIVWDKDWNEIGLDNEWNETGCTYFFNCDEDQTYHVLVIPTKASDSYGPVNVWVWENTDQEIDINLWDTYSFYNSRRAPVNYTFTAPMTGYYYLYSEYTGATSYVYTDENGLAHEESFDPTFSMYIYDNDYNTLHSFSLTPGMSEKESAFYLEEGQTVKINFYQYELRGSDHIDFSLNWAKPGFIDVDRVQDNAIDANSTVWYEFTAPANGTYLFTACNNDPLSAESNWYEFCIGTKDGLDWINNNQGCAECTREMTEGETVYVRIYSSEDSPLSYKLGVINCDQPFNTNLLENTYWDVEDSNCAEIYYVAENGFILNVTDEGDEAWNTQVYAADFPVFEGNYYKLTFTKEGQTESDRVPEVLLQQDHKPYYTYGGYHDIDMNSDVSEIYFAVEGSSSLTKLLFDNFGVGTYTFSDIELVRITEEEYRAWEESLNSNLIDNASNWSSYCVDFASDEPTHTFDANNIDIQLPVGFYGNFGAKYSSFDLSAGNVYELSFDLATDGMTSPEVYIIDGDGTIIQDLIPEFGLFYDEAQTNTYTFTATEDYSDCELIFYFYTDSVTEGSIPSSFVTISNISLSVTGFEEIIPDDVIEEVICDECGCVKPDHEDWCSHYGEDDEEESYDD